MASGGNERRRLLGIGVAAGFTLLIAGVWASGASTATSLGITGLLVIAGVAALAFAFDAGDPPDDPTAEQRRRMGEHTP